MIRRIVAVVLAIVLVMGLSGCIVRRAEVSEPRSEDRDVSGFEAVDFSGFGRVTIEQGDEYEVTVTGSGDLVDRLDTEVRGDTLYIDLESRFEFWLFSLGDRDLDIKVVMPELTALNISGAADVDVEGFEADALDLELSGAGELVANDLDVRDLTVEMSGAGSVRLDGVADTQDITISGAVDFDGRDLEGKDVTVEMSGAGSATVWARDTLEATVSGAGSVEYYGDPRVDKNVSGAGTVNDRGDK